MKRILCLLLCFPLLVSLFGCTGAGASVNEESSLPISSVSQQSTSPSSAASNPTLFSDLEVPLFLKILDESGYVFWSVVPLPLNQGLRQLIMHYNDYSLPICVTSVAQWQNGGIHGEGLVTAEEMQQTSLALFGMELNLNRASEDYTFPGYYSIPAHGPTHWAELLPETVSIDKGRIQVDTLVSYLYYEEGVYRTETLRHTFEKNLSQSAFPYRVISIERIQMTGGAVAEGIAAPATVYDDTVVALVAADELNVRQGPGMDCEKRFLLTKDQLIYLTGSDNGDWVCTYYGWVKAEYLYIPPGQTS